MKTASIRDLRTSFPKVRRLLEQEGEVVVTDRGRPIVVLTPYEKSKASRTVPVDYLARLRRRMPRPISAVNREALDEDARGER